MKENVYKKQLCSDVTRPVKVFCIYVWSCMLLWFKKRGNVAKFFSFFDKSNQIKETDYAAEKTKGDFNVTLLIP